MYEYAARLVRVVDGDTAELEIQLGFGLTKTDHFRFYGPDPDGKMGMNAPELKTPEGKAARDYLVVLLGGLPSLSVRTVKDRKEKYGRWLAVLYGTDAAGVVVNVNQKMIEAGHAREEKY